MTRKQFIWTFVILLTLQISGVVISVYSKALSEPQVYGVAGVITLTYFLFLFFDYILTKRKRYQPEHNLISVRPSPLPQPIGVIHYIDHNMINDDKIYINHIGMWLDKPKRWQKPKPIEQRTIRPNQPLPLEEYQSYYQEGNCIWVYDNRNGMITKHYTIQR